MRRRFDEQLLALNQEMIVMGSLIEQAIENVSQVISSRNIEAARVIMRGTARWTARSGRLKACASGCC